MCTYTHTYSCMQTYITRYMYMCMPVPDIVLPADHTPTTYTVIVCT